MTSLTPQLPEPQTQGISRPAPQARGPALSQANDRAPQHPTPRSTATDASNERLENVATSPTQKYAVAGRQSEYREQQISTEAGLTGQATWHATSDPHTAQRTVLGENWCTAETATGTDPHNGARKHTAEDEHGHHQGTDCSTRLPCDNDVTYDDMDLMHGEHQVGQQPSPRPPIDHDVTYDDMDELDVGRHDDDPTRPFHDDTQRRGTTGDCEHKGTEPRKQRWQSLRLKIMRRSAREFAKDTPQPPNDWQPPCPNNWIGSNFDAAGPAPGCIRLWTLNARVMSHSDEGIHDQERLWSRAHELQIGVVMLPDTALIDCTPNEPRGSLYRSQQIATNHWKSRNLTFTHAQGQPGLMREAVGGTLLATDDNASIILGPDLTGLTSRGRWTGRLTTGWSRRKGNSTLRRLLPHIRGCNASWVCLANTACTHAHTAGGPTLCRPVAPSARRPHCMHGN
jgi:hypothetical protein